MNAQIPNPRNPGPATPPRPQPGEAPSPVRDVPPGQPTDPVFPPKHDPGVDPDPGAPVLEHPIRTTPRVRLHDRKRSDFYPPRYSATTSSGVGLALALPLTNTTGIGPFITDITLLASSCEARLPNSALSERT